MCPSTVRTYTSRASDIMMLSPKTHQLHIIRNNVLSYHTEEYRNENIQWSKHEYYKEQSQIRILHV